MESMSDDDFDEALDSVGLESIDVTSKGLVFTLEMQQNTFLRKNGFDSMSDVFDVLKSQVM